MITLLAVQRHGRLAVRVAFAVLAALLVCFLQAGVALAHAELVGSEPPDGAVLERAPSTIQLYFSEPIERDFFSIEVYDVNRQRVDRGGARIPPENAQSLVTALPELGPGIYTVVWRVLSIDGHVVRGVFAFSVGVAGLAAGTAVLPSGLDTGGAPFALSAIVRWLTYLAAALLMGGFAFFPLVLASATSGISPAARSSAERAWRRLFVVGWPAAAALLVLTLLALLFQAADATGQTLGEVLGGRAVSRLLTGTKYGTLWLARAGTVVALLFALMAVTIVSRPRRPVLWTGFGLGALLLLVLAATGHASSVPRRTWLAIGADWLHLLAAAVWVGGLVQITLVLSPLLRDATAADRSLLLARLVRRFSWVAGTCVFLIVATGAFSSTLHVPTWQALADTFYGAALSGKLLLVAPLFALGAVNLWFLGPRFARVATAHRGHAPGQERDATTGARVFRRVVVAEVVLAVAVLGVTGILSGLPPATAAPGEGEPVTQAARAGDLSIALEVDPNQAGLNTFRISVADAQGRPAAVQGVVLLLDHLDMEMGQRQVEAQYVGANRFEAVGSWLSMAGRWRAQVQVRRAGVPAAVPNAEATASFTFTTGQPPGTGRPLFSPARIVVYALTPQSGLAAMVLLMAIALMVLSRKQRRSHRAAVAWTGVAMLAIGAVVLSGSVATAFRRSVAVAQPLVNPIPPTAESLARGQLLYAQNCMVCHGAEGRGDGPAARTLRPPPADLRVHMAAGHTDGQLFEWITNGVPGTAMPAFEERLSVQERWDVINFIRTFAEEVASIPAAATNGR